MKKDITPFNNKGQRHGYWKVYWQSGILWHEGLYINDKHIGIWIFCDYYGNIEHKEYYI